MLLSTFIIALFVSALVCVAIIYTEHHHAHLSMDHDLDGVQKFHAHPTSRIGGIPIFVGMGLSSLFLYMVGPAEHSLNLWLIASSLPVFAAGLIEDLTKKVSPLWRLLAAFFSAFLAYLWCQSVLTHLSLPFIDPLFVSVPAIAVIFTIFAVGGVCHSINIIDGYNGLMGGVAIIILVAFAYVCLATRDLPLLAVCLALLGGICGFMIWNFPKGMIFAGDAGAYFIGFMLAQIAVLIVVRNPSDVSPWFSLLVLVYPIFETVFSIYRRKKRNAAAGLPDNMHFHQMVYKRLVKWMVGTKEAKHITKRNSLTAPYLWGVCLFSVLPALMFWKYELILQIATLIFMLVYIWLYHRLTQLRSLPKLVLRHKQARIERRLRNPKKNQS